MDAISVAIIVTVLSIGSALVYLFKSDYERRQVGYKQPTTNNNKRHSLSARTQQNGKTQVAIPKAVPTSKQVPYIGCDSASQPPSSNTQNLHSVPLAVNSIKPGTSNQLNGLNAKSQQKQPQANNKAQVEMVQPRGVEPSSDELDSSILLGVFNQKPSAKQQLQKRESNGLPTQGDKRSVKKRKQPSDQTSATGYSSEQLFNIIAASNLSQDEIELAIESLLNKTNSAESEWQPSKGDPVQRVKNQLKDTEIALNTEVQNHELTRIRLAELKNQLQNERLISSSSKEESSKLRKELNIANLALEQAKSELSKQHMSHKQLKDESSQVISKLEQEKVQLQNMLANASTHDSEAGKLRNELEDKIGQLQRYELSNRTMSEKIEDLEAMKRGAEMQIRCLIEDCAKNSEFESECIRLQKTVKDNVAHLKELSETNCALEKSLKELQVNYSRQEDMLGRLRDERYVNESSMKRTLCEMEQELKELQAKLSASAANQDERIRKEMINVEKELTNADIREQKLTSDMIELREGLSALFPDIAREDKALSNSHDWIHAYLDAVKKLAKTVTDLRHESNNNIETAINNNGGGLESPTKKMIDKSTLTLSPRRLSSRVGSPTSNGRSSRAGSNYDDSNKKVMETKLVEITMQMQSDLDDTRESSNFLKQSQLYKMDQEGDHLEVDTAEQQMLERQVQELRSQRSKLEAQIKFGLDSLKMEQERVKSLEEELASYKMLNNMAQQTR